MNASFRLKKFHSLFLLVCLHLFIYVALFSVCITTYCIFLSRSLYPHLHNAGVNVLTNQFESGCVKSAGRLRKSHLFTASEG